MKNNITLLLFESRENVTLFVDAAVANGEPFHFKDIFVKLKIYFKENYN